jgi:hypothetical protein
MKKFILILLGFFLSIETYSLLYEYIDSNSYAINPYGNEILMEKSQLWIFVLFILLFHLLYFSLTALLLYLKRFKSLAYGIIFGLILTGIFSGIIIKKNYETGPRIMEFKIQEWTNMKEKPIPMARSVFNGFKKDLSKKEVKLILGNSDKLTPEQLKYANSEDLYYLTNAKDAGDSYYLSISFFEGNKIIRSINLETLNYHEF